MYLRFVFHLTMRLAAWLRLSRREETWKTAEILILRHQLAVLQRRQPVPLENRNSGVDLRFVGASGGVRVFVDQAAQDGFSEVCVPKTSSTSRDQAIFVDQTPRLLSTTSASKSKQRQPSSSTCASRPTPP